MKITLLIICLFIFNAALAQNQPTAIVTADIDNFWIAYDQITTTKDSSQQYKFLDRSFISKGTPGLKALMEVRHYNSKSYIDAINHYPLFWNSIRSNTLKASSYANEIATNLVKLKKLYPELKPATIYFTMGPLLTGGTILGDKVLIGSEIAMADARTITSELPSKFDHLKIYFKTDHNDVLVFTNVHEYVHTQQKTTIGDNLLAQCVLEGVAEFVAEKATGKYSKLPALKYGKMNKMHVEEVFISEMFNASNGFWLYSNLENEFKVRDLGYYVGYAICEAYYKKSSNKAKSIKEMIELDYNNQKDLINFAEQSGYFKNSVTELAKKYEDSRPTVTAIDQIRNNMEINASVKKITINFSEAMDKEHRNFKLGPLGKENLLVIKKVLGFSEDGRTLTFEVELEPNKHYQLVVGEGFQNIKGVSLRPYLIDFTTSM
jgi:hypothetical protein